MRYFLSFILLLLVGALLRTTCDSRHSTDRAVTSRTLHSASMSRDGTVAMVAMSAKASNHANIELFSPHPRVPEGAFETVSPSASVDPSSVPGSYTEEAHFETANFARPAPSSEDPEWLRSTSLMGPYGLDPHLRDLSAPLTPLHLTALGA